VVERPHAAPDRHLHLAGDVAFARRVIADEHHRQPRDDAAVARQTMHGVRDLAAQVRRDPLAVDDFCGHGLPPCPASCFRIT
jgi:hypothetical protein